MNESEYNAAAAREIAQCYEDIREKDAEIERLKTLEGAANASRALACQQMALAKDQIKRLEEALQRQDNVLIDKDTDIERLKEDRDKWEHECKIAYKAFDESNVKKMYEQMHQRDVEEHNRMIKEIARLKSLVTRAADALEEQTRVYPGMQDPTSSLVAELRKAAQ